MSHDSKLQQAVLAELEWEPSVNPAHIGVTADAGVVTLSGHVADYMQKHAAEAAAARVKRMMGVVGVSNATTIKPMVDTATLSDDITHAMHRSWFFDPKTVQVTAERGQVRLTGTVHTQHDSQLAAATAWAAHGATGVQNLITVV